MDDNAVDLSDDEDFEEEEASAQESEDKAGKEGVSEADPSGDVLMLSASTTSGP